MLTLAFAQLFYFLAYTFAGVTGGDNGLLEHPRAALGPLALTEPSTSTASSRRCSCSPSPG